jgi:hypothetical protein
MWMRSPAIELCSTLERFGVHTLQRDMGGSGKRLDILGAEGFPNDVEDLPPISMDLVAGNYNCASWYSVLKGLLWRSQRSYAL